MAKKKSSDELLEAVEVVDIPEPEVEAPVAKVVEAPKSVVPAALKSAREKLARKVGVALFSPEEKRALAEDAERK